MDQPLLSGLAFALVLLLSGVVLAMAAARTRSAERGYARLAAVFYVALAIADASALGEPAAQIESAADTIALMTSALAPVALALAVIPIVAAPVPTWLAASALSLACAGGIVATITGSLPLALGPLVLSALAIFLIGLGAAGRRQRLVAISLVLSAVALVAGAAALLHGSRTGHALFAAAALLGIAFSLLRSDARVEKKGAARNQASGISRQP